MPGTKEAEPAAGQVRRAGRVDPPTAADRRWLAPVHHVPRHPSGGGLPRPDEERVPPRGRRRPWVRYLKWSVEGVLAAGAGYAVYLQRDQVGAAGTLFSHIRWSWLVAAMAFEAASMVVFARLQRWLLRSGGVNLCLRDMVEITLAGDSLSVTLPGGVAWGATFAYEQLRRRGADRTLAGWVILVAGALSSFALFLVFAAGTELAGPKGPVSSLRLPVLAVAAIPLVVAGLGVAAHRRPAVRRALRRQLARAGSHLPEGERAVPALEHLGRRLRTVQPSAGVWAVSLALAIANWLCDAATLFACIEALGFPVPWMGLLVAYSLAQISASLPITPGGIGVVEGSLTLALVAYGMGDNAAVASALLYRIVSFWALVPIGWSAWAYLELAQRRGRRPGRHHPWAWHHQRPDQAGGGACLDAATGQRPGGALASGNRSEGGDAAGGGGEGARFGGDGLDGNGLDGDGDSGLVDGRSPVTVRDQRF